MINHINEVVVETIKKYNSNFNDIIIKDNVLYLNNDSIELGDLHLDSLFESYQLKKDLINMNANELFNIIKINAKLNSCN